VGGAVEVASRLPKDAGTALVKVASAGFITAMDRTVLVGAAVAFAGALVALVFLPARATARTGVARAGARLDRLAVNAAHSLPVSGQDRAVLDATFHVLAEAGFSSLNFNAIAARSGVDTARIERRWRSRVDLVNETIRALVSESLPVPDTGSTRDDARAYLEELVHLMGAPDVRPAVATLVAAANRDPELGDALRASLRSHREATLRGIIERGVANGDVPATRDPDFVVSLLVGPIWHRLLVTGEDLDGPFASELVDAVLPVRV
jgi:AcrR family transcriptional regulator